MSIILETERLIIRPWDPETDAQDAFEMYSDPMVTRYIGREVETSLDSQRDYLRGVSARYAALTDGSFFWAIAVKGDSATGEVVGAAIFKELTDALGEGTGDYEVGWHLKRSAWGNGYATESAIAAINYAFALGLPEIYAIVLPENDASKRVALRAGMEAMGVTAKYKGRELDLFRRVNGLSR